MISVLVWYPPLTVARIDELAKLRRRRNPKASRSLILRELAHDHLNRLASCSKK